MRKNGAQNNLKSFFCTTTDLGIFKNFLVLFQGFLELHL